MRPGTRVGSYEIIEPIGAGGMGEVYRARDVKLSRDVAIKVLPRSFASDPNRLSRLEREARTLASLNHPNIAAIYGLESIASEPGPAPALVLEFVDGPELGDYVASAARGGEAARVRQALTLARQIADGLDAAHERGVIHRDLKPANIRVSRAGVVKVLDFGLAKSAEPVAVLSGASSAPTAAGDVTEDGMILGTVAYMSPEQARGLPLDKRTDVWSFGCVLYEMLAGSRVFTGATTSDVLAATLHDTPDYTRLAPSTPPIVRRLLKRCLEKDVRQRLRDIADARADLDEALSPSSTDSTAAAPSTSRPAGRRVLLLAIVAAFAAGAAAGFAGWVSRSGADNTAPVFDHLVRIVSTAAHEYSPVISPDGKWIAYLSNARGPTDVWVKFIAGGDPVNLTAASGLTVQSTDYVTGLDVSPDGTQIAVAVSSPELRASAWVIPAPLGGVPRRILKDGDYGLRWSPDGKRIVFVRTGGPLGDALVVADADGQKETVIAKREGALHSHWPRWSPDGRYIYFNHGPQNFNIEQTEVFRVPSGGGPIEPVVATPRRATYPFPDPSGRGVIYAGNPDTVDLNLWWHDLKTGRDTRLTSGVGEYTHPSVSPDGRRLVGTVLDARQSLARVTFNPDGTGKTESVTDGYSGDVDPVWSPDGAHLVFASSRSGSRTLWAMKADLSQPAPLTTGAAFDERPAISPDGKTIAFVSDRGGRRGVWAVAADGGTPRLVAAANAIDTISWSPDGSRLVFATPVGDAPGLATVNIADGKITPVRTPGAASGPSWSRNDVIAYVEARGGTIGAFPRLVRPDGGPVPSSPLDAAGAPQIANGALAWSPDGKRLAATVLPGAAPGSLWLIDPFAATPYRKVLDFPAGLFVRGVSWTPDGSSLIIGEYRWSGDIFLAERKEK